MRVLAIAGSLRRASYNHRLLEAARHAHPALTIDVYDELASIPLFDEDLERESGETPFPVLRLRERVARADGLLLATPEYNQSIPAVMKNVLDWLSRPGADAGLVDKPVALVGVTTGRWGTRLAQAAVRHALVASGALVLPRPMFFAADAASLFDADGRLTDAATSRQLAALLSAFERWITLVGSPEAGVRPLGV